MGCIASGLGEFHFEALVYIITGLLRIYDLSTLRNSACCHAPAVCRLRFLLRILLRRLSGCYLDLYVLCLCVSTRSFRLLQNQSLLRSCFRLLTKNRLRLISCYLQTDFSVISGCCFRKHLFTILQCKLRSRKLLRMGCIASGLGEFHFEAIVYIQISCVTDFQFIAITIYTILIVWLISR